MVKLPDHSIRDVYLSQILHLWCALIIVYGDIVSLDGSRIDAERSACVVYLLLKDSGGSVDVDGRELDS